MVGMSFHPFAMVKLFFINVYFDKNFWVILGRQNSRNLKEWKIFNLLNSALKRIFLKL